MRSRAVLILVLLFGYVRYTTDTARQSYIRQGAADQHEAVIQAVRDLRNEAGSLTSLEATRSWAKGTYIPTTKAEFARPVVPTP